MCHVSSVQHGAVAHRKLGELDNLLRAVIVITAETPSGALGAGGCRNVRQKVWKDA